MHVMYDSSFELSIIAYFCAQHDRDAARALGYRTVSETFKEVGRLFERSPNFLKLRRDEFDALPSSRSARVGWKDRPPRKGVVELGNLLERCSFQELSKIAVSIVNNQRSLVDADGAELIGDVTIARTVDATDEDLVEHVMNATDDTASLALVVARQKRRILNTAIIRNLKQLYDGYCQLCRSRPFAISNADICEAHHICYFSVTQNNNASNIVIICPNHHRLIHKCNPEFIRDDLAFRYMDGSVQRILLNHHLNVG